MPSVRDGLIAHLLPRPNRVARRRPVTPHSVALSAMRPRTMTGQYATSDSGNPTDDENSSPTGTDDGSDGSADDAATGDDGSDGGTATQQTAPSDASSTSEGNVAAPGDFTQSTTPTGPAPSSAPVLQSQSNPWWQNHLLWYVVGGAVVATIGILIWRHFGHHGVKAAVKAASYYGW